MAINRKETAYGPGSSGGSDARKPGKPQFVSNGTGSVTIDIDESANDAAVVYALRKYTAGTLDSPNPFLQHGSPITFGASEDWQTAATWGNITVPGLTDFIAYSFDCKAKGENGNESGYSDESATMNTLPLIDEGLESDAVTREVTGGNVIVDETYGLVISGSTVAEVTTETQYYGVITFTYKLKSYDLDTASIDAEYSEDGGSSWATATSSGGDGKTSLATSADGTAHTFGWDSYTDAGASEYQRDMMFRIRAKDAESDASDYVNSAEFILYNRPGKPTVTNSDSRTWDEDTTPIFQAPMPIIRGGGPAWPVIRIYLTSGMTLVDGYPKKGVEDVAGWEYETSAGNWVALTPAGIDGSKCNGVLKMRYTVQTALAVGEYSVTMTMSELRDWG